MYSGFCFSCRSESARTHEKLRGGWLVTSHLSQISQQLAQADTLRVPPDPGASGLQMTVNNPFLFLPLFLAFWCAICVALSFMGGWHALGQQYRATQPFGGRRWHLRSASMRLVNYGGVLTLGANAEGLFISVLFPFRLGHPPLFIPWSQIESAEPYRQLFFPLVRFRFKKSPSVSLSLSRGLVQAIVGEAQGHFSLAGS
ncbi:MAG: hypothetical protein ACREPP_02980 [Rhodanobacteraceae bacterium]